MNLKKVLFSGLFIGAILVSYGALADSQTIVVPITCTKDSCEITTISCPSDMVRVYGERCTSILESCRVWLDDPSKTPAARCKVYYPSGCIGDRVWSDFCIDSIEYTKLDETLPTVNVNFFQAEKLCEGQGKRLCKETEWEFACTGPYLNPYPTGLEQPSDKCNIDITKNLGKVDHLVDHRVPSGSMTECKSWAGIFDMVGNADEWVKKDKSKSQFSSILKGGWWSGGLRHRCLPATKEHSEIYSAPQVGFRCCKDSH